ncbi:MAG: AzlD domain-containing protein [Coriobacteriales bacterium]|jgi:branched-subunit amino acid transport protein|nr:AzlD domain-containing protein [Coriobacteriales bacterium]
MSWSSFLIIVGICIATMLASRVLPVFLLKGRDLPPRLSEALELIPSAAFAALVANDLFSAPLLTGELWPALIAWLAAIPVVVVAVKFRSLLWCTITGVAAYALLLLIPF